jgi:hypothetical protein
MVLHLLANDNFLSNIFPVEKLSLLRQALLLARVTIGQPGFRRLRNLWIRLGAEGKSVKGKVSRGKKDLAPNVEPVMMEKHRHLSIKHKMAERVSDESQRGIFFAAKLLSSKHASLDL